MVSRRSAFHQWLTGIFPVIWLLIAACGSLPTDAAQPVPTCIPSPFNANPYNSQELIQGVRDIYTKSQNLALLGNARQDALYQLGQNMEHWSAQVDVVNDNAHMIRGHGNVSGPGAGAIYRIELLHQRPQLFK